MDGEEYEEMDNQEKLYEYAQRTEQQKVGKERMECGRRRKLRHG